MSTQTSPSYSQNICESLRFAIKAAKHGAIIGAATGLVCADQTFNEKNPECICDILASINISGQALLFKPILPGIVVGSSLGALVGIAKIAQAVLFPHAQKKDASYDD